MPWTVAFHEAAVAELEALPDELQARLNRISDLITENGLERLPPKLMRHIDGKLWEFRLKGRDAIARAFYVTRTGQRVVIVHVMVKKTQKSPSRTIKLALRRAEEIE
jgi:phage-related protein